MNSSEFPDALESRFLFDLELEGLQGWNLGATPLGVRQIDHLRGRFFGALSGLVVGGNDRLLQAADSTFRPDAHLILEADGGALMEMRYRGVAAPSNAELRAFLECGTELPAYYHRTSIQFNTAASDCAWLNGILAVGFGRLRRGEHLAVSACYRVFHVL
jgi:hypothetical protein